MKAYVLYDGENEAKTIDATATVSDLDLDILGLSNAHPGYKLSGKLLADINSIDLKNLDGTVDISDFRWTDISGQGLVCNRLRLLATPDNKYARLRIESPFIEGELTGHYDFEALVPELKEMLFHFMPALKPLPEKHLAKKENQSSRGVQCFLF